MPNRKIIELTRDRAINGKPIIREIKGYDCKHYHWTKDFGIINSYCDLSKTYYLDCKYFNSPRNCEYFVCQKKILEVLDE